ncbi:hypothetical protein RHODO2019_16770 [Rhodococcus antarcticus]|jgi:hypothetical protein|uniref:Uncharacterized protein n=1 Tax=Rhodococcus antarcticus TaxID=2987751 RepID=A0ABY6NZU2_9NOCA|nr:hypothetical protein [Rhodococcus antarcticus]UZJ24739.1 hypothetical protein RHODO2019_16770 [Rhodococcus antarcticus]
MAGKNKGGREAKKPKTEKLKSNASQPSTKGAAGDVVAAKVAGKRPAGR